MYTVNIWILEKDADGDAAAAAVDTDAKDVDDIDGNKNDAVDNNDMPVDCLYVRVVYCKSWHHWHL